MNQKKKIEKYKNQKVQLIKLKYKIKMINKSKQNNRMMITNNFNLIKINRTKIKMNSNSKKKNKQNQFLNRKLILNS